MTRSRTHDDPWAGIDASPSEFVGRRIKEEHPLVVYWIRSDDGLPGLLIRGLDQQAVLRSLPKPRGISIQVSTTDPASSWARLILQRPEDHDVFQALCHDVIAFAAREASVLGATAAFFRRLTRWHTLLSRGRSIEMGPQEVRGLIGELCFLEILAESNGYPAALKAWVAPNDHPQDFALGTAIVEVKTRLSGSRPQVQISSLEQLESAHLPLHLLVFELAPSDAEGAFSLNDIAARVRAQFQELGISMQEAVEDALASRGYLPKDAYGLDCYRMVGMRAFAVKPDFPRLTRNSIDNRVRQANYVLDLSALTEFEHAPADLTSSVVS